MTDPSSQIVLSPLMQSDSPTLFRWINDRDLVQLSAPYKPISEAEHNRWFAEILHRPDTCIFAIRLRAENTLIGTCQLHSIDRIQGTAELQIRIGEPQARGRGYGTEAVQRLVEFGFRDLNLRRISLHVFTHNAAAKRVYEKVGFVREATVKNAAFIDGAYVDTVVMAVQNG
jgi:RimJ/RimL family protein N-acetyltransferase